MRISFNHLERFRVREGFYGTYSNDKFGMFNITQEDIALSIMATDGLDTDWEHVSVSAWKKRNKKVQPLIPNWTIMCFVKDLFWLPQETVIQFHPKSEEYVNQTENVLHLWKHRFKEHELPPSIFVGIKNDKDSK